MKIFLIILVSAIAGVMSCVEGSQFPPADIINNCDLKTVKMQEEIWKDVVGYEGLYQVSDLGRVKSLDRRVRCRYGGTKLHKGSIRQTLPDTKSEHARLLGHDIAESAWECRVRRLVSSYVAID